jgi:hypothetical protein
MSDTKFWAASQSQLDELVEAIYTDHLYDLFADLEGSFVRSLFNDEAAFRYVSTKVMRNERAVLEAWRTLYCDYGYMPRFKYSG